MEDMVIRVPEMTINMTRLGFDAMRMEIQEIVFGKYLRRTAERTNCEVLDDGCILDFKGALELHNGPVLAFTAAAFHRNVHLWDVDVDAAKMPLQILKLNHVRHLLPFKIQENTHRQAGKGRWKRVVRASSSSGLWREAEGGKILAVQYVNG